MDPEFVLCSVVCNGFCSGEMFFSIEVQYLLKKSVPFYFWKNTAYLPPKQACWGLTDVISTQVLFATCGEKYTVSQLQGYSRVPFKGVAFRAFYDA